MHRFKKSSLLFIGLTCAFLVGGCASTQENQEVELLLNQACSDFKKLETTGTYYGRTILFDQIERSFLVAGQLANSAEFISYSLYAGSERTNGANMRPQYVEAIQDFCESR